MTTLLITIIIIISILLILLILVQNPKGQGLSSQFGGASTNQFMGIKQANTLLERITWGFAISIFLLVLLTTMLLTRKNHVKNSIESPNIDKVQEHYTLPTDFDHEKLSQ